MARAARKSIRFLWLETEGSSSTDPEDKEVDVSKSVQFFATAGDLYGVLDSIEVSFAVTYSPAGLFDGPSPVTYLGHERIDGPQGPVWYPELWHHVLSHHLPQSFSYWAVILFTNARAFSMQGGMKLPP